MISEHEQILKGGIEMETENLVTNQEATKAVQQKDAVFNLAVQALGDAKPAEGQPLKSLITKEIRKVIRVGLYNGIKAGTVDYKKSSKTDGELKKYCSSLINNWLKKDPRFN